MKEYIVTVDKLNIRSTPTDKTSNNYLGYLLKNEIVFLREEIVLGDAPKGSTENRWHSDHYNRVINRDGVTLNLPADRKERFIETIENYWKISKGRNVAIALIDSGVASHPNIPPNVVHKDITNTPELADSHGTRMAGLISGQDTSTTNSLMVGLAPEALIFDFKIKQVSQLREIEFIQTALDRISELNEIRVINISREYNATVFGVRKTRFERSIEQLITQGKIIVAATGNQNQLMYPGSNGSVITVGVLVDNRPVMYPNNKTNPENVKDPDCYLELFEWPFCDVETNTLRKDKNLNSSEATALMSTLIALKVSINPLLVQRDIKQQIRNSSKMIDNTMGVNIFKLDVELFLNA